MTLKNKIEKNKYNRIDITSYSNNELSLLTYNTEELYKLRYNPLFIDVLKAFYRFTKKQLDVLLNDLKEESNENMKECFELGAMTKKEYKTFCKIDSLEWGFLKYTLTK